jgi:hypothetical protein
MGKTGQKKTVPMTSKDARYRIWRSVRMTRRFTLADLAAMSDASLANVRKYLAALLRAGYVRIVKEAVPAYRVAGRAIYSLANDTGPFPPRVRADGSIFDANLAKPQKEPVR